MPPANAAMNLNCPDCQTTNQMTFLGAQPITGVKFSSFQSIKSFNTLQKKNIYKIQVWIIRHCSYSCSHFPLRLEIVFQQNWCIKMMFLMKKGALGFIYGWGPKHRPGVKIISKKPTSRRGGRESTPSEKASSSPTRLTAGLDFSWAEKRRVVNC